jgi:uncharacterized protein (DUF2267 family)
MSDDETKAIRRVKEITQQIIPMLSGEDPNVVGGALGELVGIYFAGHNPASRDEVKEAFAMMVDRFIEIIDTKRRMEKPKDWDVVFSDRAQEKLAEDPKAAAAVREQLSRVRQVMAEYEAGRFASIPDALRSIGMEPVSALDVEDDDV